MMLLSKSAGTFRACRTSWIRWIAWAWLRTWEGEPTPILPALPVQVALFLVHRAERDPASLNAAQHPSTAINSVLRLLGLPAPSGHLASAVLKALRRTRGRPVKRAKPLTVRLIKKIVAKWGAAGQPVYMVMVVAMILLGFAGFFSLGELLALNRSDVVFTADCVRIFVEISKTDQVRLGTWVVIARTGSKLCPVDFLEWFMDLTPAEGEEPLFRTIWRRSVYSTGHPSLGDKRMPSSTFHTYLRAALVAVGLTEKEALEFSGHSLRRGGSTAAAQKRVPGHWRMHQGRWKSMESADLYVGAVTQDAMQLTLSLGL